MVLVNFSVTPVSGTTINNNSSNNSVNLMLKITQFYVNLSLTIYYSAYLIYDQQAHNSVGTFLLEENQQTEM